MEDPKMFQSYTNKFNYSLRIKHDIREVINIFTSEDIKNNYATWVPNVVSYEFYEWYILK